MRKCSTAALAANLIAVLVRGQDSIAARNLQGCGPTLPAGDDTFELSRPLALQFREAAYLVKLVESIDLFNPEVSLEGSGFDALQSFSDLNDVAIVARNGSTCYAGFRGTNLINILDAMQLFYQGETIHKGCRVSSSMLSAYFSEYYEDFRAAVTTCMESATEIVLTGYSQGGAIGLLGSMDLKEYNPKVVSFAAIRALAEPCAEIDTSRVYRFVGTGDVEYDAWAVDYNGDNFIHVGHAFLLDHTATTPGVYLGLDNDPVLSPTSSSIHKHAPYWSGMEHLIPEDASCFPVVVGGWETGHWCTRDDECQSGICFNELCSHDAAKLLAGEECSNDTVCKSGVCRQTWPRFTNRCN